MASVVGEASSSTPPSTSIPPSRLCNYHVFLSFSGKDTRKGFTDHLCASLERKGITTFRDDKDLEKGEVIAVELPKAIEESIFAVIILSPNYTSSTWCLDELQKIVECKNNMGLEIVPVFYDVEPSDLRHQRGSYEAVFRKHEERFRQDIEKIKRWRDALTQITNYSGWDSKNQHEARLVESIAEHLHKKLIPKLSSCTKNHVGIASKVEEVIKIIGIPGIQLNNVCFVGIWGMGGIGKTTIARAVYEAIRGEFRYCCFLRNVRELQEKNDLVHLQKSLLSSLNISTSNFHDIEDGKNIIKTSLCNKEVLIVLDDVSDVKQLKNLAENEEWFGKGSKIIITTRDKHLLNVHGVHGAYEVKGLDNKEASQLFCLKSFRQPEPKEGYLELSKAVVKYTKGLPLAVEVLGSYLHGRNNDFWHSTVNEIRSGPPPFEISKALSISYNHLMPTEQNIFLDIACFFKGEDKDEVVRILKMCDYYVGIGSEIGSEIGTGIVTLIDKSLLTVDQSNRLEMHDLLQEMGRQIVYEQSQNNPGGRSRLWSKNDINQVLTNDMGTEKIQGIVLRSEYCAHWSTESFSKISQLKLLVLSGTKLPLGLNYLPRSLKVLHWKCCSLETLPLPDQTCEVVEIQLQHSDIKQIWHGKKFLEKLKYLDLSYSGHLRRTPDLTGVPNLKTIILEWCGRLRKVHPSLLHHKNLVLLKLSFCRKLKTLPGKLKMCSLKELIITDCQNFENPPEFGECMKKLSKLSLSGTPIRELHMSLGCLVGLEDLSLSGCDDLVYLPDAFDELKSLKTLDVGLCYRLRRFPPSMSGLPLLRTLFLDNCGLTELFPHDFCHLSSLMYLDLCDNDFISMPASIHKLPKLRWLRLENCKKLLFLPKLPPSIRVLEACYCDSLNISESIILSTVCNIFKSPSSQDHAWVFRMMISGKEIPPWFVHRQDGNHVSVPNLRNCPEKERIGVALCFLLRKWGLLPVTLSLFCNSNKFVTRWNSYSIGPGYYLYILYLTNDYLSDEFHGDDRFELSIKDCLHEDASFDDNLYDDDIPDNDLAGNDKSTRGKILKSTACWVRIEDIEDLNQK